MTESIGAAVGTEVKANTGNGTLKQVLGFRSLVAVAIGLVVSQGVMVMILQGIGLGGLGFLIPLTIAFLLAIAYAFSFSELALMLPKAGSLSTYTEVAIGHFPAMVATFAGYVVVAMFALSAELLLVDLILSELFPGYFSPMVVAIGILVLFTALNIIGVDIFARLQSLLAFTMITILVLLGCVAVTGSGSNPTLDIQLFENWNPAGSEVLSLIAIAIWGFVGAEFVCPMVEETRNPSRNIPRSMITGICIIMGVYLLYCLGALLYVPTEQLASDSLPHKTFVFAVFGENGRVFLAAVAITATCSTVNTSMAAIPRMLYGMAKNGQALPVFKQINRQFQTPWVAIVFIALITGLPLVLLANDAESVTLLLISASLAWLLAYIIAHVDVIVLRRRLPDLHRPFKTPFYPLPQILGILGMGYACFHTSPSPELTQKVYLMSGAVLGLVCIAAALWVRLVMKKRLFQPEPIESVFS
ncbi:APC family permease [Pseudomaricurvus alkylphenolicus]|uniref:APC family permease n=1 Tax=Pseudomaricurvus alkylphenolicus TaxID=1306991 RepID=UPI0014235728|nr:APC family permease [Pseudomaricurvus alkylphenolicus]NIB41089.1 APC family permease [Pseudomaricurvus alkylphenolicus]